MISKHQIVQLTSHSYSRPYQATYQVVAGRKVASMTSNWTFEAAPRFYAWAFDLRQLQPDTDRVDLRITSEVGVWQGIIPRSRLPAASITIGCTQAGGLKPRGKYAHYFRRVA